MGLLLGAFHEPLAGRVDPLARRVGVLPLGDGPALADVLVEGLCDGVRAVAAFRGVFCRGARVGSRAASRARGNVGVSHSLHLFAAVVRVGTPVLRLGGVS